ncbi:phage tail protein [candidate division KSB1 bacterium]|nr:phage tail sheath subtilisin-like domain-containing protein [candidate division KSB1 bacterium]RQW07353.1 MAG: phage tail protein [candidate division KSB1 bacterium]
MATYKTPDVYVEEISLFPPSVAEVETAIPAFIGYTEKASKDGQSLTNIPTKIDSFVEFEQLFGGPPPISPEIVLNDENRVESVNLGTNKYLLYDSMRLFFNNGGGKCYIVSVGDYKTSPALGDDSSGILGGLKKLEKEDEPTILVSPDATLLGSIDLYSFQQQALQQCNTLQDRVTVCDLKNSGDHDTDVEDFRNNIGINSLKYGAAYTPWLRANYPKKIKYRKLTLKRGDETIALDALTGSDEIKWLINNELKPAADTITALEDLVAAESTLKADFDSLVKAYNDGTYATVDALRGPLRDVYTKIKDILVAIAVDVHNSLPDPALPEYAKLVSRLRKDLETVLKNAKIRSEFQKLIFYHNAPFGFTSGKVFVVSGDAGATLTALISKLNTIFGGTDITITDNDTDIDTEFNDIDADAELTPEEKANKKGELARDAAISVFKSVLVAYNDFKAAAGEWESTFEASLVEIFPLYKNIITKVNNSLNELPPSGAVAGVYAKVDSNRGVWKAPANVSIASVIGPVVKLDSKEQEDLNVDVNAGKSINAIRAFSGKGTLVWGARTLAGNDNEWRYVSVRRFFNMVEESVKKSTYWAVFEPNDANTWIRVKSMIENYLIQKWKDGALAGASPDEAFYVKVGLGTTMTAIDILEGRMIVEIGMAVVRPAEFIILRFSHKMQES